MSNSLQKTLVLLRHGQSTWNLQNRFTGWTDVGLSEQGHAEAIESGRRLATAGLRFDIAFTSVLKRAIKTLWLALEEMDQMWIPVRRSWRRKSERLRPVVLPAARGPEHFAQCHQTLARLERTDGLPLEDLLIETQSRLARDATVFVILQEVTETAALALGLLVRQGYSVAAIVNNYENDAFEIALSRLLAQRIAVYHLLNEESIPSICKDLVLRY